MATIITQNTELMNLVRQKFKGDEKKALKWLSDPNPSFSMASPLSMIRSGKISELKKYLNHVTEI